MCRAACTICMHKACYHTFSFVLQMLEVTGSGIRSCMPSFSSTFTLYKPARRKQDDDFGPLLGISPKSLSLDFVQPSISFITGRNSSSSLSSGQRSLLSFLKCNSEKLFFWVCLLRGNFTEAD